MKKKSKQSAKPLPPPFPYEKIGEVFICRDSSNVIIQTFNMGEALERHMVTCEFVELMEPTQPCWQVGMEKLFKQHSELLALLKGQKSKGVRT